jgi:hypothetical protein
MEILCFVSEGPFVLYIFPPFLPPHKLAKYSLFQKDCGGDSVASSSPLFSSDQGCQMMYIFKPEIPIWVNSGGP